LWIRLQSWLQQYILHQMLQFLLLMMLGITGAYKLSPMVYERPIAMMPLPLLPLVVVHLQQL
jgi:hypothetical protein